MSEALNLLIVLLLVVRAQILKETDGSYLLSGMLTIRDANRQLRLELPEDRGYTTLGGFLMAQAGRLPQAGEVVEYPGMTFRIERLEGRRIRRVRLERPTNSSPKNAVVSIALFVAGFPHAVFVS